MIAETYDGDGTWQVPPQIRPEHRRKFAVVYHRQATLEIRDDSRSTEAQHALVAQALQWGWPESLILVIDDLGLSGTSSHLRSGFQRLLEMMERDEVGIVLVRELSHLSRDPLDAERFLKSAIRRSVLVEISGLVYDPTNDNLAELFGLRIQALLAWWENQRRVTMVKAATEAKLRHGLAVSRPPIGYVRTTRGKWVKDDPAVRVAVRRVFDLYLRLRSIDKVARRLREQRLTFPRCVRGELRLAFIGCRDVHRVLTNPNYTGDYVFGRCRVIPRDGTDRRRLARVPLIEWIISHDHHEPYVTRAEWAEIQSTLRGRQQGANRRPDESAGRGDRRSEGRARPTGKSPRRSIPRRRRCHPRTRRRTQAIRPKVGREEGSR